MDFYLLLSSESRENIRIKEVNRGTVSSVSDGDSPTRTQNTRSRALCWKGKYKELILYFIIVIAYIDNKTEMIPDPLQNQTKAH